VSCPAAQSDDVPAPVRTLRHAPESPAPVRYARDSARAPASPRPADSSRRLTRAPVDSEAKLSVAFILLNEFTLFAFSGFVDALRIAGDDFDNSRQRECRWTVIAPTLQPVRANCGVEITPWETFPDPSQFDYVVVIGGRMEPQRNTDPRILDYLRRVADQGVAIIGVCTATFVLARAGVMKGRRCCVHWNARSDFEAEFPGLDVESDTIFLEDHDRITCPGGQSSADVALHLIAKHCGSASARKAAAGMVLEEMRGNRTPQPHAEASWYGDIRKPLVRRAITIMDRFINKDLSVTEIAQRLQVSNNTLYRAFQQAVGESPARFFRIMRLAHGHWSLLHTNMSIAQIAHIYRFSDASHFTRMHRLLYGMPPAQTRALGEDGLKELAPRRRPTGVVERLLAGGLFIFY
jgi:transcriptional regulator GlxA family with amidase domain